MSEAGCGVATDVRGPQAVSERCCIILEAVQTVLRA